MERGYDELVTTPVAPVPVLGRSVSAMAAIGGARKVRDFQPYYSMLREASEDSLACSVDKYTQLTRVAQGFADEVWYPDTLRTSTAASSSPAR